MSGRSMTLEKIILVPKLDHNFYFLSGFPFMDTGDSEESRGREGGVHFLFHSTTSTRSRTFRHLFVTLHVRWLSHIFNRNTLVFTRLLLNEIYHLLELQFDWCKVSFYLFTWWYDTRFLLQQSWYGKPVDSNSHQLSPLC